MVGLGGNQAPTRLALSEARRALEGLLGHASASSLYRTAPQLDVDQPAFWNAAVVGDWPGELEALLDVLQDLERRAGRRRDPARPKGPRVLDLDLLWAQGLVVDTPRLRVPHPALHERRFALEPLLELQPLAAHPLTGVAYAQICQVLPDQGVERSQETW